VRPGDSFAWKVVAYYGFREETTAPVRRREGPSADVIVSGGGP
jgi:hypothetical protein